MTARSDRLWLLSGIVAAAILALVGWVTVISPQYANRDDIAGQALATRTSNSILQHQLAQLKTASRSSIENQWRAARSALPSSDAYLDVLDLVYQSSADSGASLDAFGPGTSDDVRANTSKASRVTAMPYTIVALGTKQQLQRFLLDLQDGARAVIIDGTQETPAPDHTLSLQVSLRAFALQ